MRAIFRFENMHIAGSFTLIISLIILILISSCSSTDNEFNKDGNFSNTEYVNASSEINHQTSNAEISSCTISSNHYSLLYNHYKSCIEYNIILELYENDINYVTKLHCDSVGILEITDQDRLDLSYSFTEGGLFQASITNDNFGILLISQEFQMGLEARIDDLVDLYNNEEIEEIIKFDEWLRIWTLGYTLSQYAFYLDGKIRIDNTIDSRELEEYFLNMGDEWRIILHDPYGMNISVRYQYPVGHSELQFDLIWEEQVIVTNTHQFLNHDCSVILCEPFAGEIEITSN